MLQINQNIRTSGFGMGEQVEMTASVGIKQMVIASGITAGMMALATILVDGVKHTIFKKEDGKVMLLSDKGLEVTLDVSAVDAHIDNIMALKKVAVEALEKEAAKNKKAEEAEETKETKGKTEEEKKA